MKTIQDLKLLVADDRLDEAFEQLVAYVQNLDNQLFNQVVLLKSQFKNYLKRQNLNLTEGDNEKQRIVNGLINLIDDVRTKMNESSTVAQVSDEDVLTIQGDRRVVSVLWANIYGFEIKNTDLVMLTMHPESPVNQGFREYIEQIFKHDIVYKILSLHVEAVKGDEAYVKMVLESRTTHEDTLFRNNISTSLQVLKKDKNGFWKIWTGEILELKYLENY